MNGKSSDRKNGRTTKCTQIWGMFIYGSYVGGMGLIFGYRI